MKEKALTRARDALAAERRRMPWLAVEKAYEFDGPKGKASLLDLFDGRRQLIVYRAFFEPGVFGWPEHACRGCSLGADQVAHLAHLNARDTTLAYASRAPQADIARLKARMGWEMPWYTITDGFDADFGVDEWHGHNAFIRDGDDVFRTYFINNRGDEAMGTTWSYLDITPLGRQETWEDSPEGYPQTPPYKWWNWHDNYDAEASPDPKWVEVSDAGEAAFRKRDERECSPGRNCAPTRSDPRRSDVPELTASDRPRAVLGVSALLFAVSAAVTIVWCTSMSAMGGMPMPGGWTMSMAWMRMPGQTWPGAAASFLGMWVVMMVAMMLPSLVPMLRRYRQAVGRAGATRLGALTAIVGAGYFFVWTVFGMAVFPLGAALAAIEMQQPALARAVPIAAGVVVLDRRRAPVQRVEGTSPCLLPGSVRLALARMSPRATASRHGLATRPAPRPPLQPLLCRSDGDPSGHRGHGPSRDGGRDGSHHRRTSRTGR